MKIDFEGVESPPPPHDFQGVTMWFDPEESMGFVEGGKPEIFAWLYGAIEQLAEHAPFVGGDDEYFDYFPSQVDAVEHIAEELGDDRLLERVKKLRLWAFYTNYAELEPETIIGGGDDLVIDEEIFKAATLLRKARHRILWGIE